MLLDLLKLLLGILDSLLAALLIPCICLVVGMHRELKATRAKLEETQAQLRKAQKSNEFLERANKFLLDEKFGRAKKPKPKPQQEDWLSADDPLDAIMRQVGVHQP